MKALLSKKINISGAVQGVGFRPFVYKIAQELNLFGEVFNNSAGVVILLQCTQIQLDKFLSFLNNNAPELHYC
jgi:hydrogenase maturation protein HypF